MTWNLLRYIRKHYVPYYTWKWQCATNMCYVAEGDFEDFEFCRRQPIFSHSIRVIFSEFLSKTTNSNMLTHSPKTLHRIWLVWLDQKSSNTCVQMQIFVPNTCCHQGDENPIWHFGTIVNNVLCVCVCVCCVFICRSVIYSILNSLKHNIFAWKRDLETTFKRFM